MNIWTIMTYELRRLFRSRSMLLNMFLLPLVLIFLLGASLSGVVGVKSATKIEPVRVAVVNPTGEGQSAMIAAFLKLPDIQKVIVPQDAESRQAAESGLRTGKYGYAVIVPDGFDSEVQQGGKAQLEFILGKNHTDNLTAGTAFDNFLSTVNYKQAAAAALGPQALAVAAPSSGDREAVKLGDLNNGGRTYTASQFYAASMLLMFLLYSGMTVTNSLFSEKDNHTLHRINSMPVKASELFIGKMLGVGIVSIIQCTAIILLSDWLFGVYWGNRPGLLLLFCLLMIIASMTMSIVVSIFSKTAAGARSIISVITVGMTFISGGMAPLPDSWVNTLGAFTINHWVLQAIIRMMLHSGLPQLTPNLLMISVICLVMLCGAIFSYWKVGYHE
ncbi:ABC transporter permease [Paenibacillus sonchi]|uniref:ABC transporter permease n=2 Tax=Paenibacillus sonchi TaxID=373687 RepID=A0A974SED8_9BACL|nr:ABC transporter permease [Paenibacillus sonchi]QQZ62171.1 ABC transporter permease [Paenibacillus sonchi]